MILGVVCARYRSQGHPGKAWAPMCGLPVIEHAIEKAFDTRCDEIVTSHDIPRSEWSRAGVIQLGRPEHLTGPGIAKWDVWRWVLEQNPSATMLVDIDVTRPLTLAEDVDACIDRLEQLGPPVDMVMAIAQGDKHPAFDILESHQYGVTLYSKLTDEKVARQQLPPVYYHGGVYAVTAEAVRERDSLWSCLVKGHEIPLDRARDIDTPTDWKIVEMLMAERYGVAV